MWSLAGLPYLYHPALACGGSASAAANALAHAQAHAAAVAAANAASSGVAAQGAIKALTGAAGGGAASSAASRAGQTGGAAGSPQPPTTAKAGDTFAVLALDLPVFESSSSWTTVRRLQRGDVVTAAGPPDKCDGFDMLPVKPAGAVELKYLTPHTRDDLEYVVLAIDLPVFESASSWTTIRRLSRGDTVQANGQPESFQGFDMLPIKPRGAVELKYLEVSKNPPGMSETAAALLNYKQEDPKVIGPPRKDHKGTTSKGGEPRPPASLAQSSYSTAQSTQSGRAGSGLPHFQTTRGDEAARKAAEIAQRVQAKKADGNLPVIKPTPTSWDCPTCKVLVFRRYTSCPTCGFERRSIDDHRGEEKSKDGGKDKQQDVLSFVDTMFRSTTSGGTAKATKPPERQATSLAGKVLGPPTAAMKQETKAAREVQSDRRREVPAMDGGKWVYVEGKWKYEQASGHRRSDEPGRRQAYGGRGAAPAGAGAGAGVAEAPAAAPAAAAAVPLEGPWECTKCEKTAPSGGFCCWCGAKRPSPPEAEAPAASASSEVKSPAKKAVPLSKAEAFSSSTKPVAKATDQTDKGDKKGNAKGDAKGGAKFHAKGEGKADLTSGKGDKGMWGCGKGDASWKGGDPWMSGMADMWKGSWKGDPFADPFGMWGMGDPSWMGDPFGKGGWDPSWDAWWDPTWMGFEGPCGKKGGDKGGCSEKGGKDFDKGGKGAKEHGKDFGKDFGEDLEKGGKGPKGGDDRKGGKGGDDRKGGKGGKGGDRDHRDRERRGAPKEGWICTNCSEQVKEGHKWCFRCGTPVPPSEVVPRQRTRRRARETADGETPKVVRPPKRRREEDAEPGAEGGVAEGEDADKAEGEDRYVSPRPKRRTRGGRARRDRRGGKGGERGPAGDGAVPDHDWMCPACDFLVFRGKPNCPKCQIEWIHGEPVAREERRRRRRGERAEGAEAAGKGGEKGAEQGDEGGEDGDKTKPSFRDVAKRLAKQAVKEGKKAARIAERQWRWWNGMPLRSRLRRDDKERGKGGERGGRGGARGPRGRGQQRARRERRPRRNRQDTGGEPGEGGDDGADAADAGGAEDVGGAEGAVDES